MTSRAPKNRNSGILRLEMDFDEPVDYDDSWTEELDELLDDEKAFWFSARPAGAMPAAHHLRG